MTEHPTASVPDGFTLLAVGDLVLDGRLSPRLNARSPDLAALVRSADVAVANFETTAFDPESFPGWPAAEPGGSWLMTTPDSVRDVADLGFQLVSRANNHATDWGVAGMRATDDLLDRAGIAHAGTGSSLAAARAPAFADVGAARVALVSAASRYQAASRASDPWGGVRGRPGCNGLRSTKTFGVDAGQLAVLAQIRDALPAAAIRPSTRRADAAGGTVTLDGTTFALQDDLPDGPGPNWTLHPGDVEATLRSVRDAQQSADLAVLSIHTHEPGNHAATPPTFLRDLARRAIDAGASAVLGHGPHQLRGIELHAGRPIFHSLGNFVFHTNRRRLVPREVFEREGLDPRTTTTAELLEHARVHGVFAERLWFESVVARCRYRPDGSLHEIVLHPLELHADPARAADRGTPRLATGEDAHRILGRLRDLSHGLGTEVVLHGTHATVTP